MKNLLITFIFLTLAGTSLLAEEFNWPFLDNKAMGTYDFIKKNPEFDGRGVVIFILDNSVDPTIPGLLKTSTGETKVIDMQDFSGQVMLSLTKAEKEALNSETILKGGGVSLSGWDKLALKPQDEEYYIAVIDEAEYYKNSAVKDINNNGKTDDKFAILAYKLSGIPSMLTGAPGKLKPEAGEPVWVYYVDQDADGNIDDEEPMFNYAYKFDTFDFFDGQEDKRPLVTMSANILPDSKEIMVNTCDGSHGSHCAGIASGYKIYGTEGNDGIAPGAYVVSLKIGSNILSGGATTKLSMKKAYEYGVEFMKKAGFKYGVYSMSYGIGSEIKGDTDIEKFLNNFCTENPHVSIVTSNGNEGPGINSTGNPAGARSLISVGAMLTPDILENLYGSSRRTNWVTHFSSRGSECPKPDVVAPAGASSTVPAFEHGDAFWGTSMSCPQVAGASAVLLSAALKNNWEVDGSMIKKAIKFTADPMPGYTIEDQGNGLVNIQKAYSYLESLVKRKESEKIYDYDISGTNTFYPDNKGPAVFFKAGGYIPSGKQAVTIKTVFSKNVAEKDKHDFYRVHKWKSTESWLKTDKSETYIRGELPATVSLIFDESKMKAPGLYIGKVFGYAKNEKGDYPDIEIQAAAVVPHKFNASNNYRLVIRDQKLSPGDVERVFVEVPPAASSMKITLKPSGNKHFGMASYLFSPDGNNQGFNASLREGDDKPVEFTITGDALQKGIWEVLPYCYYQAMKDSYYDLEVKFYVVESMKSGDLTYSLPQGEKVTVSNSFISYNDTPMPVSIKAGISGYTKKNEISHSGGGNYTKSFTIDDVLSGAYFSISMEDVQYGKMTDLAVNIYDKSGKAVYSSGMSRRYHDVYFQAPGPGEYRLELVPAFATASSMASPWEFEINEYYMFSSPASFSVNNTSNMLYPYDFTKVTFEANSTLPMRPDGFSYFTNIEITDTNTGDRIYRERFTLVSDK